MVYYWPMIGSLNGTITHKNARGAIVEVNGVGYLVNFMVEILAAFKIGDRVSILTYLAVKENALDLYGFLQKEELDLFTLLINISGIGPKSALAILSLAPPEVLRKAVMADDVGYLTKVSGIGRKSAEKIIIELKDKIGTTDFETRKALGVEGDVIDALESLGFSLKDIREAVKKIPAETKNTNDRIKEAIKILGAR